MLVRAHDCYTLDCSVDGIAEVLKVSREITNILYQGKHYKLMVCMVNVSIIYFSFFLSLSLSLFLSLSGKVINRRW